MQRLVTPMTPFSRDVSQTVRWQEVTHRTDRKTGKEARNMKRKQRAKVVLWLLWIATHYLGLIPTRCCHKEKVGFSTGQYITSSLSEVRIIYFTRLIHPVLHFCMFSQVLFLFLALTISSLIDLNSNWPQQCHLQRLILWITHTHTHSWTNI